MFRLLIAALLLVITLSFVAFAELPVAKIDGPESPVEIGDLIELSAAESTGDGFLWLPMDRAPPPFRLYESGKRLVFAAKRPGTVRFLLIASGTAADGEVKDHVIVTAEVEIEIIGPDPNPGPGPTPDPEPATPDRWGLRKSVSEWGTLVTGERALSRQLASNFRSIAALAKSGKLDVKDSSGKTDLISTLQAMNAAIGAANVTLPATARPHWLPMIRNINERLTALCDPKSGSIKTVPDLAQAFEDIAAGMDAIKESK